MGILAWIILGLIAGWLAGLLFQGHGFGFIGDTFIGIVGAILGGLLGSALFGWSVTGLNFSSIILSVIGAIILLAIVKALTPRRTYP